MKIAIRFADADRARLGCQEWLPLDFATISGREAAVIQRGFDLEGEWVAFRDPQAWLDAFVGTVVTVEQGKPVTRDVVDEHGATQKVPVRMPNWGAEIIAGWLALRRAGVRVSLGDLDFQLDGLDLRAESDDGEPDDEPEADQGKDHGSTPPTTSTS